MRLFSLSLLLSSYLRRTRSRGALAHVYRHPVFHISTDDTSRFVDCLLCFICDLHLMSVQLFLDLKVSPLCVFSLYQLTENWSQQPIQSVAVQTQKLTEHTNKQTNKKTKSLLYVISLLDTKIWISADAISQSHPSDVIPMGLMSRQDGNVPCKIFLPHIIGIQRLQLARVMSAARSYLLVLPCIMLL
jgi:hypothetical protein